MSNSRAVILLAVALLIVAIAALWRSKPVSTETASSTDGVGVTTPPTKLAPEKPRTPPLADPPAWIDPYEVAAKATEVAAHVEPSQLPADAAEETVFKDIESRWKWLTDHRNYENDYLTRAQELRALAQDALKKWPASKHRARIANLSLRTGEFFPIVDSAGDEFWLYVSAEAAEKRGAKPAEVGVREIQRAYDGTKYTHVLAYGKMLLSKSPNAPEAFQVHLLMGRALQNGSKDNVAARKEYLEAAKSSDEFTRLSGKRAAFDLARSEAKFDLVAQDASSLLQESSLKAEDRSMILSKKARALYQIKQYDAALECVRSLLKEYPKSAEAAEGARLEKLIQDAIFSSTTP